MEENEIIVTEEMKEAAGGILRRYAVCCREGGWQDESEVAEAVYIAMSDEKARESHVHIDKTKLDARIEASVRNFHAQTEEIPPGTHLTLRFRGSGDGKLFI